MYPDRQHASDCSPSKQQRITNVTNETGFKQSLQQSHIFTGHFPHKLAPLNLPTDLYFSLQKLIGTKR